jgi:hypothetical protein
VLREVRCRRWNLCLKRGCKQQEKYDPDQSLSVLTHSNLTFVRRNFRGKNAETTQYILGLDLLYGLQLCRCHLRCLAGRILFLNFLIDPLSFERLSGSLVRGTEFHLRGNFPDCCCRFVH